MRKLMALLIGTALLTSHGMAVAEQDAEALNQQPQAQVRAIEDAGQQVEETRVDGRLESVRVKPRTGPEYFIQDRSRDGTLSAPEGGEMDSRFNIRTWKIGEW